MERLFFFGVKRSVGSSITTTRNTSLPQSCSVISTNRFVGILKPLILLHASLQVSFFFFQLICSIYHFAHSMVIFNVVPLLLYGYLLLLFFHDCCYLTGRLSEVTLYHQIQSTTGPYENHQNIPSKTNACIKDRCFGFVDVGFLYG